MLFVLTLFIVVIHSWRFYRTIDITPSYDATDEPVLIEYDFTSNPLGSHQSSDYLDIKFVDDENKEIEYYRESVPDGSGAVNFWLKLDLVNGVTQQLKMIYDDDTKTGTHVTVANNFYFWYNDATSNGCPTGTTPHTEGLYIKNGNSYSASIENELHEHTNTGTHVYTDSVNSTSDNCDYGTGSDPGLTNHYHEVNFTLDSTYGTPVKTKNLHFCGGSSVYVYENMLVPFLDDISSTSCTITRFSDLDDRYPRTKSSDGTESVNDEGHYHRFNVSVSVTWGSASIKAESGSGPLANHIHAPTTVETEISFADAKQYVNAFFGESTETKPSFTCGNYPMYFWFNGPEGNLPMAFEVENGFDNTFLKGSDTSYGVIVNGNTHNHTIPQINISATTSEGSRSDSNVDKVCIPNGHEHIVSESTTSDNEIDLPAQQFLFIKRRVSSSSVTIGSENIITCYSIDYNDASVCTNQRGNCTDFNKCECEEGYYGDECEISECNGIRSDNESVCNNNGNCTDTDTCECIGTYTSDSYCSDWECNSIDSQAAEVCNNQNGECLPTGLCNCSFPYTGDFCDSWECNGIDKDDSNVCNSGNGTCLSSGLCDCTNPYSGDYCESWECNGIDKDNEAVCNNGKGTCTVSGYCENCASPYAGNYCESWSCNNIEKSNSSVCNNGEGICEESGICNCSSSKYFGDYCDEFKCNGKLPGESGECDNHGTCTGPDYCVCDNDYSQLIAGTCSLSTTCGGIISNDTKNVCSGHGTCVAYNNCSCKDNYYNSGDNGYCDMWMCGDYNKDDDNVCNGHGICVTPGPCECDDNYNGDYCEEWTCNEIDKEESDVCNGNGECIAFDTCDCSEESGKGGNWCNQYFCFDELSPNLVDNDGNVVGQSTETNASKVCSGAGECIGHDKCECQFGYQGDKCEQGGNFGGTVIAIFNFIIVENTWIGIIIIVVVILFLVVCVIVCVVGIVLLVVTRIGKQKKSSQREKANKMFLDMENKAEEELQNYLILT